MRNTDKILEIAKKNGGYITTKEIVKNKINTAYISRLVKCGDLERISTGYYCVPNTFVDDYFKVLSKSKNAIFSHTTALYLYDLSDRTPIYFDVTVPFGYGGSLQKENVVSLHYVNRKHLKLGLKEMKSPFGLLIRVYDLERTICDIIKDKNKMDLEIYAKALKAYSKRKDKDLLKLVKYAKELNIEKEVIKVMEVLL